MTLVGASLGGAIALDFAHEFPEAVKRLVLIDAQGFIDGSGPGASLPGPLAKLGISVLGSRVSSEFVLPLRSYAASAIDDHIAKLDVPLPSPREAPGDGGCLTRQACKADFVFNLMSTSLTTYGD